MKAARVCCLVLGALGCSGSSDEEADAGVDLGPALAFEWSPEEVEPDGLSTADFTFVMTRRDGTPYTGPLVLSADPPGMAQLDPPLITPAADGSGAGTLTACDLAFDRCPSHVRVRFAAEDAPDATLVLSPYLRYAGVRLRAPTDAGADPPPEGDPPEPLALPGDLDERCGPNMGVLRVMRGVRTVYETALGPLADSPDGAPFVERGEVLVAEGGAGARVHVGRSGTLRRSTRELRRALGCGADATRAQADDVPGENGLWLSGAGVDASGMCVMSLNALDPPQRASGSGTVYGAVECDAAGNETALDIRFDVTCPPTLSNEEPARYVGCANRTRRRE